MSSHEQTIDEICGKACPWVTALDYVYGAVSVWEREQWPLLGRSTTQRALRTLGYKYNDAEVKCLVCFVCGQQRLTLPGPAPPPPRDRAAGGMTPGSCNREIENKTLVYFRGLENEGSGDRGTLLNKGSYALWQQR